jgi:protein-tyrosine phosphatase
MISFSGKMRRFGFSLAALGLHAIQGCRDRLAGRPFEGVPNYTQLEPCLFLGGTCAKPPPGVRAVLCLTPTRDSFTTEFYEFQPVPAGSFPSISWLRQQVEFIDRNVRNNIPVLVHCDAGIDRSATVVIAYLMWRDRKARDDALDTVSRKRSVKPNPAFMELLGRWEETLQLTPNH